MSTPQILTAFFVYRDRECHIEVLGRAPTVFGFICPLCHTRLRIDRKTHDLSVSFSTQLVTIEPEVVCGNRDCGWQVTIQKGVAEDVGLIPVPAIEQPASTAICEKCGGEYAPTGYRHCDYCRSVSGRINGLPPRGKGGQKTEKPNPKPPGWR